MIETTFGKPTEMYSLKGIGLLQREIEHFKKAIDYDAVVDEINQDMKRLGLKKIICSVVKKELYFSKCNYYLTNEYKNEK